MTAFTLAGSDPAPGMATQCQDRGDRQLAAPVRAEALRFLIHFLGTFTNAAQGTHAASPKSSPLVCVVSGLRQKDSRLRQWTVSRETAR